MGFDGLLYEVLYFGALGFALYAFVDALLRPAAGYAAAGKLSKPGWLGIIALAALVLMFQGPMTLLGMPAIIASAVYLVDVRPAVGGLRRKGNPGW
jgi:hypothetical protein